MPFSDVGSVYVCIVRIWFISVTYQLQGEQFNIYYFNLHMLCSFFLIEY